MTFDRQLRPIPSAEVPFSLPKIINFELENGLKVLFVKKDDLPILRFNLIANTGSKLDPKYQKGLANLLAMTIDEGAGEFNALELSDEFETLGTHFGVRGNHDSIFITMQTLEENFERSLELFTKVLAQPLFNEKDFAREQNKILTRIMQLKDEPDEAADIAFHRFVFQNSSPYAYPTIGFEKSVKNISAEDIKNFYAQYFAPNNSSLIVVGSIEENELQKILSKHLNNWKRKNISSIELPENKIGANQIYIVDKKSSVQSEIRVGHLSGKRDEKDYFQKFLLNTILGGQFTSRINLNLREKKGYTYGASSAFGYYKDAGYFGVNTSVGIENTANAVQEIIGELERILNGVTKEELEFAKSSIVRKFPSNFETYSQIASNLSAKVIHSLPDNYFNDYIKNINSVPIEEVNKAAAENISPDKLIIVIVGDKEKIKSQFKEINIENFIETNVETLENNYLL
jgi:zinc protease